MMNRLHSKNHYVPECYLQRWENSAGKVYVYRTLVSHPNVPIWKPYFVSAIAYQRHLYTQVISGNESDALETWLDREFESPANPILEKATCNRRLSKQDWEILIKFLAAQDVRTPAKLLEHLKRMPKILGITLKETLQELKRKLKNEGIDSIKNYSKTKNTGQFPIKVNTHIEEGAEEGILKANTYAGRSTWIHSIKHLLNHTSEILHTHKWSIIKPAKGYFWPTSDNPVVKVNYYSPGKYDLKGGWGNPKGNILFPIGPEHALFVQIDDRPIPKGSRVSEQLTKELIKFIVGNANRLIFCNTEDVDIPRIRKRIIDQDRLKRENEGMKNWLKENADMEREYFFRSK